MTVKIAMLVSINPAQLTARALQGKSGTHSWWPVAPVGTTMWTTVKHVTQALPQNALEIVNALRTKYGMRICSSAACAAIRSLRIQRLVSLPCTKIANKIASAPIHMSTIRV